MARNTYTRLFVREALARALIAEMDAADRAFDLLMFGFVRATYDAADAAPGQRARIATWNDLLSLSYAHRDGARAALVALLREGP